jgi:hypothetical protein
VMEDDAAGLVSLVICGSVVIKNPCHVVVISRNPFPHYYYFQLFGFNSRGEHVGILMNSMLGFVMDWHIRRLQRSSPRNLPDGKRIS